MKEKGQVASHRLSSLAILRGDLRALHYNQFGSFGHLVTTLGERVGKLGRSRVRTGICPPLTLLRPIPRNGGTTATAIHSFFLDQLKEGRGLLGYAGLVAAAIAVSVPANILMAFWATAINGKAIERRIVKPVVRQLGEELALAFRYNIMPPWYYQFDLHDDAKRARAGDYLHRFELKGGLYRLMKRRTGGKPILELSDKREFAKICRINGLPCLSQIALVAGSEWRWEEGYSELPQADLFTKPRNGNGGTGAKRWDYAGSDRWTSDGSILEREALIDNLKASSRQAPLVVQVRAKPHPDIADLSNGALTTVRMVTMEDERGNAEPVVASFRMAIGRNTVVDNFHAGGIMANVDLATGTLGRATDIGLTPDIGWVDMHPDTGGRISGRVLPCWPEVLALARQAHQVFRERVIIGWDIGILEDGPCLVEGNGAPDTDMHQRVMGAPLGSARFGQLLAFHLGIGRLDLARSLS